MIIKEYLKTEEATKILLFTAEWCGPCGILKKTLKKVIKNYQDDINIYKINVDKESELANSFNVRSIPTLLFIKNNKVEKTTIGIASEETLKEMINKLIS